MGTSLSGLTPANTYTGLLKFGDNSAITASLKVISDGAGNDTMLELSTTALQIGGSTGMYWDNTNKRLGIGTNSPTQALEVYASNPQIATRIATNGTGKYSFLANSGSEIAAISLNGSSGEMRMFASGSYFSTFYSNGAEAMRIDTSRNVNIGGTGLSARVGIKGSGSTSATTSLLVQNSAGNNALQVRDDRVIIMAGLPTSSSGLPTGALWNNLGVLSVA